MKRSAGVLLYRTTTGLEVFIVHPSGSYNKNAAWSIPKGEFDSTESPEHTARRELLEETGIVAPEKLIFLGDVIYKSCRKQVYCFAGKCAEASPVLSWEIDRAEFVPIEKAAGMLHSDQADFLNKLKNEVA